MLGVRIEQFEAPVCNSFKARVVKDQICYELSINDFLNSSKVEDMGDLLKDGIIMLLDYNLDRQIGDDGTNLDVAQENLMSRLGKAKEETAQIYLDAIGSCKIEGQRC